MDVKLLFQISIPLGLACGILQAVFWLRWRQQELLWWAAADWFGTFAVILLVFGWAGNSLPQTILFASGFLLWLGIRRFAGQRLPLRTFAVIALLYFTIFEALRFCVQDLAIMIVFASLAHGLLRAGVAFDLARAPIADRLRGVRAVLVVAIVLHGLFYLFRSATAVTLDAHAEFLNTVGLQSATLVIGMTNVLIWNVAMLWLVAERRRDLRLANAIKQAA